MVCLFVTLEIQDGKQEEFESVFRDLMAEVRKNEPGNVFYQLARDDQSATTYHVLEAYSDKRAFDAHGKSEYLKASQSNLRACLAEGPKGEMMEGVV